jgi:hypothetical protein
LTSFHFSPPSSERQSEPRWPVSISAYTRRESLGAIATAIFPRGGSGRPCPVNRFHVVPPSRDRKTPLPGPPLFLPQVLMSICQRPATRTRGLPASIERSEAPVFSSTKRTRSHDWPPSFVR